MYKIVEYMDKYNEEIMNLLYLFMLKNMDLKNTEN